MSCERFSDAISDHAYGAPLGAAAAAHLAICDACRRMLRAERKLLADAENTLHDALSIEPSPGFTARVEARVRRARPRASFPAFSSWWWIGATGAAVLALGVYLAWPKGAPPIDAWQTSPSAVMPQTPPQDTHAAAMHEREAEPPAQRATRGTSAVRRETKLPPRIPSTNTADPVVIVPPDQQRAIARLRDLLRVGILHEANLPPPHHASAELVIEPLRIPQIEVPDLPATDGRDPHDGGNRP